MGKSGGGSAPAAPDPVATSEAQANAYIKSAKEASKLNNLNIYGPYGDVTFDKDANGVPIAQRTTLSPDQQAALDAQVGMQAQLSNAAALLAGQVPTQAFELPGGMPDYRYGLDMSDAPDYMKGIDFNSVPNMPGTGDYSADRDSYSAAMFERGASLLRPEFERQNRQTQQMLSDRGLPITGEAYDHETSRVQRGQEDTMARLANDAIAQGASEQSRLFGLGLTARQQGIGEQLQGGQVAQMARSNIMGEEMADASMAERARQLLTGEALTLYNAPAQAAATLLGAAPKTPTAQGGSVYTAGVGTPNVEGNVWNQYNAQMSAYNQKQQQNNSMWGGIGSIVGSIGSALLSDEEMKEDRAPADSILERVEEMPVDSWKYTPESGADDGLHHVGPMAQDFKAFLGLGDGRTIPIVDGIGVNMAATKQLAKKVRKMEQMFDVFLKEAA